MRTMTVDVDGMTYTVTVGSNSHVTINGQQYSYELLEIDRHRYVLVLDGHAYRVAAAGSGSRYQMLVGATQHIAECARVLPGGGSQTGRPRTATGDIMAPMPALVARVLVAEGDSITAGQGLIVLEAMKMENELRSARAGVVKKIHVTPGISVEKDQLLLVVE